MARPVLLLRALVAWCALLSPLLGATRAVAELGGSRATIMADRAHFAAGMTQATAAAHTTYTLALAGGGSVDEYADADGTVFAVSWHAPGRPDLAQLLGPHFAAFDEQLAARHGPRMSRHVAMSGRDLVVHSSGHPGAFYGVAYLPGLLPPGFDASALR